MVRTPEFERTGRPGVSWGGDQAVPEEIHITAGAEVRLRYKDKHAWVRVTKVVAPQEEFEGMIESFDNQELEHADLQHGDVVRFSYDKIGHIYKWIEEDQPRRD